MSGSVFDTALHIAFLIGKEQIHIAIIKEKVHYWDTGYEGSTSASSMQ